MWCRGHAADTVHDRHGIHNPLSVGRSIMSSGKAQY
jgi:hypothetical protein